MFVHARIAGLIWCALAVGVTGRAAETQPIGTQRWQVVNANDTKVGHVRVTRTVGENRVIDSERVEVRLGKAGRRARYRLHFETESTLDGSLLRRSGAGH